MLRTSSGGTAATLVLLLSTLAACGSPSEPEVVALQATPAAAQPGQVVTVAWTTRNALAVELDVAGSGKVDLGEADPGQGEVELTFDAPGEFTLTLTAMGEDGTTPDTASATVEVAWPPARIDAFQATPGEIRAGQASMLTWTVRDAVTVRLATADGTDIPLSEAELEAGAVSVEPSETTRYVLTAEGEDTTDTAEVLVTVNHPAAIEEFAAEPSAAVLAGEPVVLSWVAAHAQEVQLKDEAGAVLVDGAETTGTFTVHPTVSTSYSLVAQGAHGSDSADLTVHVAAVVDAFTVTPTTVRAGDTVTISWRTSGASSFSIIGPSGYRHAPAAPAAWAEGTTPRPALSC